VGTPWAAPGSSLRQQQAPPSAGDITPAALGTRLGVPEPESDDDDDDVLLLPSTRRHTAARRSILLTDSDSDEPEVRLPLGRSRSSGPAAGRQIQAPGAEPAAGGDEDGGSDSGGSGVPAWRRDYGRRAAGSGVPGASRADSGSSSGAEGGSSDDAGRQDDMFSFPDDLPISR
jgi:hypothetical protein